jgi:hypothetical protein
MGGASTDQLNGKADNHLVSAFIYFTDNRAKIAPTN